MTDIRPLTWMALIELMLTIVFAIMIFLYERIPLIQIVFIPFVFLSLGTLLVWSTVLFIHTIVVAYAGLSRKE